MTAFPEARPAKEAQPVLVWHVFQGVMVCDENSAPKNRFNVYWQTPRAWHDPHDEPPEARDADRDGYVLILDEYGAMRIRSVRYVRESREVRKWARIPAPPEDCLELRKEAE